MTRTQQAKIEFEQRGIGAVLQQNRLAVPLNQREYSWTKEEVAELLGDLAAAIRSENYSYFLGTIVLTNNPKRDVPEIADGQQRLATTTILLSAIRDWFYEKKADNRVNGIEKTYLFDVDLNRDETVPKLGLNIDDNEFFRRTILSRPDDSARRMSVVRQSHKRLADAQQLAHAHIESLLQSVRETEHANVLIEWVDFLAKETQVIVLRVPDYLNAFVLFGTLNDRGLWASQADLLKNYLLSHAGERIDEAQHKWAQMRATLDAVSERDITVRFLHHLLITQHGQMREKDVFEKVRVTVNNRNTAIQLLDELADAAKDYAALLNPDGEKWTPYGEGVRNAIKVINRHLGVKQVYPLMFAVARKFNIPEAQRVFKLLVSWSVRFLFVGGRGGVLDKLWSTCAQEVGNGQITTAKQLIDRLENDVPGDAAFEDEFGRASVASSQLARYYLRALELKEKEQKDPLLAHDLDQGVFNLEHILPRNAGAGWPKLQPEVVEAYHDKLGNLVLLGKERNAKLGNASFTEKKKSLKESGFKLTKHVAEEKEWGPDQIVKRQQFLAKLAVKTWPLTVS
jgi:hypothetical protein